MNGRKTILHAWHSENGGKMVDFAGWDMPVQYELGAVKEHLATRRGAGLFDVSHMGRFEIAGAGAQSFLMRVLSNAACALKPGEAHYTFIATESGGAIDDAYLYRLEADRFLLVVNASNRNKDWAWLERFRRGIDCTMRDVSDDWGMISLQGPLASHILEQVVPVSDLPENKRNQVSMATFAEHDLIIARTGYTGEAVCFELFPAQETTGALWEQLLAAGATAVGLGARDSLRLEAGLPLYGHELGDDETGREIPIFANMVAGAGVRIPDGVGGDWIGREALQYQRQELAAIRRGELKLPPAERDLTHLVQPIAAFGSRRPLRAGFEVEYDGEVVGTVTSGTSVPATGFAGEGLKAVPTDEHDLRPIGLALIRSDFCFRSEKPVIFDVVDSRGNRIQAELVEKNLWPSAPYTRPHKGFKEPEAPSVLASTDFAATAAVLRKDAQANTAWRRERCINLIPSENSKSPLVDALSVSDPAGRYNEHNRLNSLGPDAAEVCYYKGTDFMMEKEAECKAALRAFFGCAQVEPRVISGQMANDIVYDALKQYKNRFVRTLTPRLLNRVLVHDLNKGGHLSAQVSGALKNYVAMDPETGRPAVDHFPQADENPYLIDIEATKALIAKCTPELIVFGRSVIIHKEPIAEIAAFVHDHFGRDNPERPIIHYDAAHVLGLLGEHYNAPFAEGADLVTGSTHKTFFGPQRGVVLGNFEPGSPFEPLWKAVETRAFPGHVSNHHLGTLLGLLGATYEMLAHKDTYPVQVMANAKAFARALSDAGLQIEGDGAIDFTETHQVLLRTGRGRGETIAGLLEASDIITNPQAFYDDPSFAAASGVRMGTQEMTRFGMIEADFAELASLVAEIVTAADAKPKGAFADKVNAFRARFQEMHYTI